MHNRVQSECHANRKRDKHIVTMVGRADHESTLCLRNLQVRRSECKRTAAAFCCGVHEIQDSFRDQCRYSVEILELA